MSLQPEHRQPQHLGERPHPGEQHLQARPARGGSVSDESTYPFTFDLTITQRFEATDPMAINGSESPIVVMHLYRQSIILFGAVLPIVCAAAVGGIGYMVKSRMTASFENKQQTYKTYEQGRIAGLEIEPR
jgi:hypothetical protein